MVRAETDSMIGTTRAIRRHHVVIRNQRGIPVVVSFHPDGDLGRKTADIEATQRSPMGAFRVKELKHGEPYMKPGSFELQMHGRTDHLHSSHR